MPNPFLRDPYDELSLDEQRMVDEMLSGRKMKGNNSVGTAATLMVHEDQDSDEGDGSGQEVLYTISDQSMASLATRVVGVTRDDPDDGKHEGDIQQDLKALDITDDEFSARNERFLDVECDAEHDEDCSIVFSEYSDPCPSKIVLPVDEDYETILTIVNDTPSAFPEHFDCDDPHDFTPYAITAAEQRVGLAPDETRMLNETCDPSLAATSLSSGLIRRRLAVANHSRFKRYLETLSLDPPPKSPKAYNTLRNLLLSIMNETSARDSVCVLGGVDVILKAMAHYETKWRIQMAAISALGCLADEGTEPRARRRLLIAEHCGVARILRAMQNFKPEQHGMLFEEAYLALYKIVQHPANAEQFGYNRGVRMLVRDMKALPTNLTMQKSCIGVLLRTCHVNQDFVACREVYDAVCASLDRHPKSAQLHRVGCLFWRQLVTLSGDSDLDDMLQCNVVVTIIGSISHHPKHKDLLRDALATLSVFSRYKMKARLDIGQHGMTGVLRCVKTFQRDVILQREAFKILRSLRQLPPRNVVLSKTLLEDHAVANIMTRAGLHSMVLQKARTSSRKVKGKKRRRR